MREKAEKTMNVVLSVAFLVTGFLSFADGNIFIGMVTGVIGGTLFVISE
jgi:hypothetical protein